MVEVTLEVDALAIDVNDVEAVLHPGRENRRGVRYIPNLVVDKQAVVGRCIGEPAQDRLGDEVVFLGFGQVG